MNTARFLRLTFARWYIAVVGMALTLGLAYALYAKAPTVYWAETTVTLLQASPNPLNKEGFPLTDVASALVIDVNGETQQTKTSSPDTTLYGEGIYEGTRVRLRDIGGQWATWIPGPVILVESVGPQPDQTAQQLELRLQDLQESLDEWQNSFDVPEGERIFLQFAPEQPAPTPVKGNRIRAVGGTLALGSIVTGLAIYFSNKRWPMAEISSAQRGIR